MHNNFESLAEQTSQPQKDNKSNGGCGQGQMYILIRFALVFVVGLLLLIPVFLLQTVVYERNTLYDSTIAEIESGWGERQVVVGPILVIPYKLTEESTEHVQKSNGKYEKVTKVYTRSYTQLLLPKKLSINAEMLPEERYLGIYSTTVYSAPVSLSGEFEIPENFLNYKNLKEINWDEAKVVCGIPDIRALRNPELVWGDSSLALNSGTDVLQELTGMHSGFNAEVALGSEVKRYPFSISLKLMGSQSLGFTPVGEVTQVRVVSDWTSPNFMGQMLPDERQVDDSGFSAAWNVSSLNRSYPQTAEIKSWPRGWDGFVIQTSLTEPVSLYRKVTRAVKYGLLFVGVTFIGFLAFELASRRRLHYVQYGLVGISMVLFFLTLLALAEHISFVAAYTLASIVVIGMIASYIGAAFRSLRHGAIMAFLLAILYVTLYILLQLEDYALLMGTAIILIMAGVLMFVTRRINQVQP